MSKYLVSLLHAKSVYPQHELVELTDSERSRNTPTRIRSRANSQGGEINALCKGAYAYRQYLMRLRGPLN